MPMTFKKGDRVRTGYKYFEKHQDGTIQSISGWYIYVKLDYEDVVIEVYPNEITLIEV